jgi:hypothetical protein
VGVFNAFPILRARRRQRPGLPGQVDYRFATSAEPFGAAQIYNRYNYAAKKRSALALWGEYVERLTAAGGLPIAA